MTAVSLLGSVPTRSASRYLQQLCKHWSHKFETRFDADAGEVALPMGRLGMAAEPEVLRITLSPKPGADLERLKKVVEEHLNRFAFREAPLAFTWQDGEA